MRIPRGRGDYNTRIRFYKATVSQETGGQPLHVWPDAPFAKRWAQRSEVPPSLLRDERFEAQTWVAKAWIQFRVPFDLTLFATLNAADVFRIKDPFDVVWDVITGAQLPNTKRKVIDIMAYTRLDGTVAAS